MLTGSEDVFVGLRSKALDSFFAGISLRDISTALLDLVMPRRCVVCHTRMMLRERFICTGCLADLPLTHFWERSHNPMADKFNALIASSPQPDGGAPARPRGRHRSVLPGGRSDREHDSLGRERYTFAAALFFYNSESLYKRIPQHLKYHGGIDSGRFFSSLLGRYLASAEAFSDVDVVVPVPLHWTRKWSRGYNQAAVIAGELSAALGVPCRTDWLRRVRRTATQTRMSVGAKTANVTGAFRVSDGCLRACRDRGTSGDASSLRPRHILIVDDTFTTGSTLNACREALREVFPPSVRISVATLAFVSA